MKTLLFLHGAIGSKEQLESLKKQLQNEYDIHTLNFPGHGGNELPTVFNIPYFADHVKAYILKNNLKQVAVFGYSMGGYVGLYMAKEYPDLVEKVITLATKLEWNETIAAKEIKLLQPDSIEQKLPTFAKTLAERHAPQDWKAVLIQTQALLTGLGQGNGLGVTDFNAISTPILLLIGDRDKMVTLEETLAVYKQLAQAQLGILPLTSHPIEQVDLDLLAFHIKRFIG